MQKAPFEQSTNEATPRYWTCIFQAVATRIDAALALDATVKGHNVLKPLKHDVFKIDIGKKIYNVDIAKKLACSCRDFMDRVTEGKPFFACKHMYYVYLHVCGMDANVNMYVHQQLLTEANLFQMFGSRRTFPNTPTM